MSKRLTNYQLDKWYLDFISEDGQAMIFYSADLRWHHWSVNYASLAHFKPGHPPHYESRFTNGFRPELKGKIIDWVHPKFQLKGEWKALSNSLSTRIIDMEIGYLDWFCYQPQSDVQLTLNEKSYQGRGYAERILMTIPAWKIPIKELHWGRFNCNHELLVWIQLDEDRKWLWYNGIPVSRFHISDQEIHIPEINLSLYLDKEVVLESDNKISSIVNRLNSYLPGLSKAIPSNFLNAKETKWLSQSKLYLNNRLIADCPAIHEYVQFEALK